jgi:CYTH domain-containing protein
MDNYEIERKFLVRDLPGELSPYKKTEITQAYISTDPTIRIRKSETDGGAEFTLTVKGEGDLERAEFELAINGRQYEKLLQKAEFPPLDKTRYVIPLGGGLFAEADIYKGSLAPLMTVEVEFDDADAAKGFTPPAWFGEDVTFDRRYKNSSLAALIK